MYIPADTLDDLMLVVLQKLLRSRSHIYPSKGPATELPGVLLKIDDPRTRLSRTEKKGTLFSCLGEFLWYASGSDKLAQIKYYLSRYSEFSDDGKTVHGAYGPRIFGNGSKDQVANIINVLKSKHNSRQAVIQLFDSADICGNHKDVPCTCTMQLLIRKNRLHMITTMRSNDAFVGLPHDVFAFTMLQELIARSIGVEVGIYKHAVGSLHLYDCDRTGAEEFINEGFQEAAPMQPMPYGDPWKNLGKVLAAERAIRLGRTYDLASSTLPAYWLDLVRILYIFKLSKSAGNSKQIGRIAKEMSSDVFQPYIRKRHAKAIAQERTPVQQEMFINP